MRITVLASCVLALVLIATPTAQQLPDQITQGGANQPTPQGFRTRDLPMPIKITRELRPGDIIARGNRVRRGGVEDCDFDFGVSIELQEGRRRVSIQRGPNCTAVLTAIEDENVVELQAKAKVPMNPLARLWDAFFPSLHAQYWQCLGRCRQQVYSHIYMWGGGGYLYDGLTAQ